MRRVTALLCLASLLGSAIPASAAATQATPAPAQPALRIPAESRDRFLAALAVLRSGAGSEAAREFADPEWASTPLQDYALLFQAESLLRSGDAAGARPLALQAADVVPERLAPSALLQAAFLLGSAGDDAGAVAVLRRFLERHGDHREAPRARFALGRSLLAAGRVAEAARAFSELWLHAPASSYAESAARQLEVLGERGLAGPAPSPRERLERAERLLAAGQSEPAKSEAEALLAEGLSTDLVLRAFKILLDASRRAGRYDAATAAVDRALAAAPPERRAPWLIERARLEQRQRRDAALATLGRVVAEYPKSAEAPEALLMSARLLEAGPKPAEARDVYVKLAAGYPEEEQAGVALWRLGWLAWFRGAHAEATQFWGRLVSGRSGQTHRDAAIYWIGRAHEERGEAGEAARRYAQLLGDAPRSYYGLLAARRRASPTTAVRSVQPAPTLPADPLQPLQADARYARVEALRAVGLQDFADEEMDELTRLSLGDPPRLYALSAAYTQESRYHMALRILRRYFQTVAQGAPGRVPHAFWEMFYPLGWRVELTAAAGRGSVDPFLVAALVREESSFHSQARSRVGARGLMQLMPETARPLAQARRLAFKDGDLLDDPGANLEMGTAFFAGLLREFGDARLATAAYNAGPTRVREWWAGRRSDDLEVWVEQIPFNETRAFVKRVMLSWDEYRRVYGAQPGGREP